MTRWSGIWYALAVLVALGLGALYGCARSRSVEDGRSDQWPEVRAAYIAKHPACAACGISGPDAELNVHHVKPVSKYPELELDPDNLITLCTRHNCHLMIGHLGDTRAWNPCVRRDAARLLDQIRSRPNTKEEAEDFRNRFDWDRP